MNRIKSIFTPAFFVRVAVIVLIILLAVFLYHYGKQHTVYVDNRMIKIGDESYRPLSRAEVSIDGMESQTYRQRTRREETVVRQKHTIRIESGDDVYEGEFTLPVNQDAVVLSLPAFVAGLGQDQYLSEFDWYRSRVINHPYDNKKFDHEGEREVVNAIVALPNR